ncbi:MAG: biotin/lipoyl-binding protein [Alphaproteobacteria bacterium]|nr:biotin/lipoyl-binding protein [Alphaproteobacteria bacterium]
MRRNKHGINPEIVRELVALMDEHGLSELEYGTSDWHARVARGNAGKAAKGDAQSAAEPTSSQSPAPPGAVTSPIVGVAFLSPEPGAPNFVNVGDTVKEGETLLLIEAMKTFNQIRAPKAGKVAQILITNGQAVEYGEVLVVLE